MARAIEQLKQAIEVCELGALTLPDQIDSLMDAGKAILQEMSTLTPPNEWISMEDRPPEFPGFSDHIMVVTCDKNGYVMPMVRERTLVGYEWVERWLYPWNKIYDGPEITHWMQMPKPLKEK